LEDVNTLLVDPPRAGLSKMFVDKVSASDINKMIYVSCDLMTLKRDLMRLSQTFTVQSIQAVDMFPHTPHVETVVLLEKKNI
ncbi:MAG TPA: 23S rRNA (uracil(1939)-C(5))-methyltransferase RlmD, partial [Erysipelothrix sp.]